MSENDLIEKVIQGHFRWYFASLNSNSHGNYVRYKINENTGKRILDVHDYLSALRDLGTVSNGFIESESVRTASCNYLLENLDKQDEVEVDIHNQCDFVYFYFWLYSNRSVNGLEVLSVRKHGKTATADVSLQIEKNHYESLIIELVKIKRSWKINRLVKK